MTRRGRTRDVGGQERIPCTRDCESPEAALHEADELIASRVTDGYREV